MEIFQIDLVFKKKPSKDENENIYINMFLVALTFFCGTLRLKSKDTIEEPNQLEGIYMTFGSPLILHCDKVWNFKVYYSLYIAYVC